MIPSASSPSAGRMRGADNRAATVPPRLPAPANNATSTAPPRCDLVSDTTTPSAATAARHTNGFAAAACTSGCVRRTRPMRCCGAAAAISTAASGGAGCCWEERSAGAPTTVRLNAAANAAQPSMTKVANYPLPGPDYGPMNLRATTSDSGFDTAWTPPPCGALLPGLGAAGRNPPEPRRRHPDAGHGGDSARGADAVTVSPPRALVRRLGRAQRCGSAPRRRNGDWHLRRDLPAQRRRAHSPALARRQRGRAIPQELARLNYREQHRVLRLAVIGDVNGGPHHQLRLGQSGSHAHRLNLGWLQVGLDQDSGRASGGP